jgi:hypothetical protein
LVSIFNFNFNVEVGGQAIILKLVTLRTLFDFFEIAIPDSWSSFSVALHNELTLFLMNTASKLGPHTQTDRGTCPGVGL